MTDIPADGVHAMVPRDRMPEHVRKLRDTYAITPGAPLYRQEFGYYCKDAWAEQGLPTDADYAAEFACDPPADHGLGQLGWCEAGFCPKFEEKIVEDRGEHELVQDPAGRHVLFFKGRRSGFMPEYLDHPVKDRRTWEEDVKWRLDPTTLERYTDLAERMVRAKAAAAEGKLIAQNLVGGYMYLRSLIGPAELLYMFYDDPGLIHDCLRTWLELADAVIAKHQEHVTLDVIYFAEDICYKSGPLISPDMMQEFLAPYYRQLMASAKARQIDRDRHLFVKVDTDGHAPPVIPFYCETIGMDVMTPFEVAADCDVVAIGREYPDLVIFGGIDKRVLAAGRAETDAMLERIIPPMRERGGYVPHCDHGVPAEVKLDDYRHYRERVMKLGG